MPGTSPPAAGPEADTLAPFGARLASALAPFSLGLVQGIGGEGEPRDDHGSPRWALEVAGLGDGLPVVVPSTARIEAMLAGRNPLAGAVSQPLPIAFTVPTWWDVAACAVLAGCEPGVLGVLGAALDAVADPAFNLLGVQTTTGAASPLLIAHGPLVPRLGLHAGSGALGPGWPINATLGRALRLALQNLGLARPGEVDMATHGHPGKFSWLVAEHQAASPWEPFSVSRGLAADVDALTVVAGVGNVEVVLPVTTPEALAARLAVVLAALAAPEAVVLLPPDGARFLDRQGWNGQRLQQALADGGVAGPVLVVVTGGAGVKATVVPGWGGPTRSITRLVPGEEGRLA